jgi:hypothetical protein
VSPSPISPVSSSAANNINNKDAAAIAAANKGMQIKAKKHVVRIPLETPLPDGGAKDDRTPSIWARKPMSHDDWPEWIDVGDVQTDTMEREERTEGLPPTIDSMWFLADKLSDL